MSEAVNLTFKDIVEDVVIIKNGKTGNRTVPLKPEIKKALLTLKDGHDASEPIFWGTHPTQPLKQAGFAGIVKKAFQNAGIEDKHSSPHMLRPTFVKNRITQDGDVASLRRILGHDNLETMQRYLALSIEELVGKNQKHNPLSDMLDRRLSTDDDGLSPLDPHIPQWYACLETNNEYTQDLSNVLRVVSNALHRLADIIDQHNNFRLPKEEATHAR